MDLDRTCTCIVDDVPVLDFSGSAPEIEEVEEIDEDELVQDIVVPHNTIWREICTDFNKQRQQTTDFIQSKVGRCEVPQNFAVELFEEHFSDLLREILVATLMKAQELQCIKYQKHTFNGTDYIAEMLWNKNPKHPERKNNWTYIFDTDWVVEYLKHNPRPYYPFSWVWTRDFGATKIQAYVRGHAVRSTPDVQEMRQFWNMIKKRERVGYIV